MGDDQNGRNPFMPASDPTDAGKLSRLLVRAPAICTGCIAAKLNLTDGARPRCRPDVGKTAMIRQEMSNCPECGREKWVVSLVK
jgi:hypothetical protein